MIIAECKKNGPLTKNEPTLEAGVKYYVQIETGYRAGKHVIRMSLDNGLVLQYGSVQLLMRDWKITSELEDPANMERLQQRDKRLELLWEQFADVPMNPETEQIEAPFLKFPVGTDRESIWEWFDERHSKGVSYLLYGYTANRQFDLMKKDRMCQECMSEHCIFNPEGVCRYPLVYGRAPVNDEDGCESFASKD